jgi:hypothetical protein
MKFKVVGILPPIETLGRLEPVNATDTPRLEVYLDGIKAPPGLREMLLFAFEHMRIQDVDKALKDMANAPATLPDEQKRKDNILDWLRTEAQDSFAGARQERVRSVTDDEAFLNSFTMDGQGFAFERTIQYVRGLTEREFQLAKRKGTL